MGAEVIAIESPLPSASRRMPPLADPDGGARDDYVDGALSVPFLKRARGQAERRARHPPHPRVKSSCAGSSRAPTCSSRTRSRAPWTQFGLGHEQLRARLPAARELRDLRVRPSATTQRPAMDVIVQAASGAMAKTGFPDGPPLRSGITIADHTTATFAALGIVAALRQRDLTGVGQLVDVAMLDVLTALVFDEPVDHYAATGCPGAHRERRRARRADQLVPLRRRLGRRDVHERRPVRTAVRS